jgi:hypothetical protein
VTVNIFSKKSMSRSAFFAFFSLGINMPRKAGKAGKNSPNVSGSSTEGKR